MRYGKEASTDGMEKEASVRYGKASAGGMEKKKKASVRYGKASAGGIEKGASVRYSKASAGSMEKRPAYGMAKPAQVAWKGN